MTKDRVHRLLALVLIAAASLVWGCYTMVRHPKVGSDARPAGEIRAEASESCTDCHSMAMSHTASRYEYRYYRYDPLYRYDPFFYDPFSTSRYSYPGTYYSEWWTYGVAPVWFSGNYWYDYNRYYRRNPYYYGGYGGYSTGYGGYYGGYGGASTYTPSEKTEDENKPARREWNRRSGFGLGHSSPLRVPVISSGISSSTSAEESSSKVVAEEPFEGTKEKDSERRDWSRRDGFETETDRSSPTLVEPVVKSVPRSKPQTQTSTPAPQVQKQSQKQVSSTSSDKKKEEKSDKKKERRKSKRRSSRRRKGMN